MQSHVRCSFLHLASRNNRQADRLLLLVGVLLVLVMMRMRMQAMAAHPPSFFLSVLPSTTPPLTTTPQTMYTTRFVRSFSMVLVGRGDTIVHVLYIHIKQTNKQNITGQKEYTTTHTFLDSHAALIILLREIIPTKHPSPSITGNLRIFLCNNR